MSWLSNKIIGTPEQREHNARFNHPDTDPDSQEYLESHDRVIAAEKTEKG
jgi:hypothetical protein